MLKNRREELNWAAGLFDGEGYAKVAPLRRFVRPQMALGMTDFDAVDRFHWTVGTGVTFQRARRASYKPVLVRSASHRMALHAANLLIEFSVVKRNVLKTIIEHYADFSPIRKLSEEDVREIRKSERGGVVLRMHYGVSKHTISRIRLGYYYAWVKD